MVNLATKTWSSIIRKTKWDWTAFSGALKTVATGSSEIKHCSWNKSTVTTVAFFPDYSSNLMEFSCRPHNWKVKGNHTSLTSVVSLQDFTESIKPFNVCLPWWDGSTSIKWVFLVFSCHILTQLIQAGWTVTLWNNKIYFIYSLFNFPVLGSRKLDFLKGWSHTMVNVIDIIHICMSTCVCIFSKVNTSG